MRKIPNSANWSWKFSNILLKSPRPTLHVLSPSWGDASMAWGSTKYPASMYLLRAERISAIRASYTSCQSLSYMDSFLACPWNKIQREKNEKLKVLVRALSVESVLNSNTVLAGDVSAKHQDTQDIKHDLIVWCQISTSLIVNVWSAWLVPESWRLYLTLNCPQVSWWSWWPKAQLFYGPLCPPFPYSAPPLTIRKESPEWSPWRSYSDTSWEFTREIEEEKLEF